MRDQNGQKINDSYSVLAYTIIKHFIGTPTDLLQKQMEILMNLRFPKLQNFKWYKDMFLSHIMIRENCQ